MNHFKSTDSWVHSSSARSLAPSCDQPPWATTDSLASRATVLTLEAVSQGNLFWQNSRCLIVGPGIVQQIYQLALGWGHGKGGSGEEEREGRNERGGGRMDEADLATVMEWGSEWEGLVGEGVCAGGVVTIRRQAGVRRSVTSFFFFFFFFPAACKSWGLSWITQKRGSTPKEFGKWKKKRKRSVDITAFFIQP